MLTGIISREFEKVTTTLAQHAAFDRYRELTGGDDSATDDVGYTEPGLGGFSPLLSERTPVLVARSGVDLNAEENQPWFIHAHRPERWAEIQQTGVDPVTGIEWSGPAGARYLPTPTLNSTTAGGPVVSVREMGAGAQPPLFDVGRPAGAQPLSSFSTAPERYNNGNDDVENQDWFIKAHRPDKWAAMQRAGEGSGVPAVQLPESLRLRTMLPNGDAEAPAGAGSTPWATLAALAAAALLLL